MVGELVDEERVVPVDFCPSGGHPHGAGRPIADVTYPVTIAVGLWGLGHDWSPSVTVLSGRWTTWCDQEQWRSIVVMWDSAALLESRGPA